MGRWLRVWFALMALFGPAALVPEAPSRPAAVSVGAGAPEAQQAGGSAGPAAAVARIEGPVAAAPVEADRLGARPLYLLNRALLN